MTIYEIRSAHESRLPLVRIGSRYAFSDEGLTPIASHPAAVRRGNTASPSEDCVGAAVRIAALFHDLGKATALFQDKLRRAIKGSKREADAVRHELHSAAVWDILFGARTDAALPEALKSLTSDMVDQACVKAIPKLASFHRDPDGEIDLGFFGHSGSLSHLIGMLILTHHRLPDGDSDHVSALAGRHVNSQSTLDRSALSIAPGVPFWHEGWWLTSLQRDAACLSAGVFVSSADIALRASLMFADHLGSAAKVMSDEISDHLANTTSSDAEPAKSVPADSLSLHVQRVYKKTRGAFDLLHRYRDRFPGLEEGRIPVDVMHPQPSKDPRFLWQAEAAQAARTMCEANEGGFFACILSGTGTGKTRGAPTILANAAIGDARPERRYLRMSLALGLRVLATQSAQEYVDDLGFQDEDVSVLVGQPPLNFDVAEPNGDSGSESLIDLPEWLHVERVTGGVPAEGDPREADWVRSLSIHTDRGLPAFCDMILEHSGKRAEAGRRLVAPPVLIGTIDHLMGVASPVNSRFLIQSIRLLTADLILDEIDQFDGEDIAAIGRLIFQSGAAGRRVIIMSATLTPDIAEALYRAYSCGWATFASSQGLTSHVNLLCTGDAPGSCFTNRGDRSMVDVLGECREAILRGLKSSPALRRGEILPTCNGWSDLMTQIDEGCSRMHVLNAVEIEGFRVSVGMVRMTRISHTAALATQIPSGEVRGRLRAKLCLHSQFPRLHRAWIETRLKRALTRKGMDPDQGVRDLCAAQGLFEDARKAGVRDIEIVVITSPVIETGNDLDFDYAVLDPISMRSIIQAAGRVRRHRPAIGDHPNILIMGRSPVAMQGGVLAMPGVETRPARETKVAARSLAQFDGRLFREICGDADFSTISAEVLISGEGIVPLRDEESALRQEMISVSEARPLGKYLSLLNARLNLMMTRSRKFRRSDTREVLYRMDGGDITDAEWYLDMAPGTRNSALMRAVENGLDIDRSEGQLLFRGITSQAWLDYSSGLSEMGPKDLRDLLQVSVSDYGDSVPSMSYTEFTGFTRGDHEDLFFPFGKIEQKQ